MIWLWPSQPLTTNAHSARLKERRPLVTPSTLRGPHPRQDGMCSFIGRNTPGCSSRGRAGRYRMPPLQLTNKQCMLAAIGTGILSVHHRQSGVLLTRGGTARPQTYGRRRRHGHANQGHLAPAAVPGLPRTDSAAAPVAVATASRSSPPRHQRPRRATAVVRARAGAGSAGFRSAATQIPEQRRSWSGARTGHAAEKRVRPTLTRR